MIVAKLIKQLPKLLSIEGYQRTGEAIALLHSIMKQETPTKLQYVHDRKTKFQSLCAIQALCPGKKLLLLFIVIVRFVFFFWLK